MCRLCEEARIRAQQIDTRSCTPPFHILQCGHTVRAADDQPLCSVNCRQPIFGDKRIFPHRCPVCEEWIGEMDLADALEEHAAAWNHVNELRNTRGWEPGMPQQLEELEDALYEMHGNMRNFVPPRVWQTYLTLGQGEFIRQVEERIREQEGSEESSYHGWVSTNSEWTNDEEDTEMDSEAETELNGGDGDGDDGDGPGVWIDPRIATTSFGNYDIWGPHNPRGRASSVNDLPIPPTVPSNAPRLLFGEIRGRMPPLPPVGNDPYGLDPGPEGLEALLSQREAANNSNIVTHAPGARHPGAGTRTQMSSGQATAGSTTNNPPTSRASASPSSESSPEHVIHGLYRDSSPDSPPRPPRVRRHRSSRRG